MTAPSWTHPTRDGYDLIATDYAERFPTVAGDNPLDRALLDGFAAHLLAAGGGPVMEVGSGPGRVTAHLHERGLDVSGVDLSPAMVGLARQLFPHLRFEQGSMTALDMPDGTLAGIVAWYSVIHILPEHRPAVFAELARALAPGGLLLVAFQVGDEPLRLAEAFGHAVSLTFHRLRRDRVADQMGEAGLAVVARMEREPDAAESSPQAFLLARKAMA